MDRFERAGIAFANLCRTMATLRADCPWDREQSLASLQPYLIEESYEVIEAIESGDPGAHCDELGDLLLQIVFQAEISHEAGYFDATDVAEAIDRKLVRRHPHVLGNPTASDERRRGGTKRAWEGIKAKERGPGSSRCDGIPKAMPALLRARRMGEKAAVVGFDWPDIAGVAAKVEEEWAELKDRLGQDVAAESEEVGDLFFALVSLCRHREIDPERALNASLAKFEQRFRRVEQEVRDRGLDFSEMTLDQLDAMWEEAKARQR